MRLGLFGGTFDPVHLGHLILAESCREALALDAVWFVVAGQPPHKPEGRTAVADRVEMVRIAIAGNPGFVRGQFRLERFVNVDPATQVTIQGALSEPVVSSFSPELAFVDDNGWPNVEGRVALGLGEVRGDWLRAARPVEVAAELGARVLVLTNASGGIAEALEPGSLLVLTGHLEWNRPDAWRRMQERAMRIDFSWANSARQYIDLYQNIIDRRGSAS